MYIHPFQDSIFGRFWEIIRSYFQNLLNLGPDSAAGAMVRRDVMDFDVVAVRDLETAAAEVVGVQEAILHRLLLGYASIWPHDFKAWLARSSFGLIWAPKRVNL